MPAAAMPAWPQAVSSALSAPETPTPPSAVPSGEKIGVPPSHVARNEGHRPQLAVSFDATWTVAADLPFHIANSATAVGVPSAMAKAISRPASS